MKTSPKPSLINYSDRELTDLLSLLKRYHLKPKKRLGQTFLFKKHIAEEIVRTAEIKPKDVVVEIGAGLGALTTILAERAAYVIALEYDVSLATVAQKIVPLKNVELIRSDALNFDYGALSNRFNTTLKIVGNLPYYITSPLIFKLLNLKRFIDTIVIMIQKEVAERIVAQPGTKAYGTISIFSQLYCDVSTQFTVTRDCFYPPPQVDSQVIKLRVYAKPFMDVENEKFFEKLVRVSFTQRRKNLLNCLKSAHYFNHSKEEILTILQQAKINPRRRPETLSIEEFNTLCRLISSLKPSHPQ